MFIMAKSKAIKKETVESTDPNILRITTTKRDQSHEAFVAEAAYDPAVRALPAARGFMGGTGFKVGLTESLEALTAQVKEVQEGNFESMEKTLVVQANTLDAIFNELVRRAALNMTEYLSATETYLRLALKAQSQCRTTLETLAEIKNPMTGAYVRQANIAAGHQQVNNGNEASCAGKNETEQSKQLEAKTYERLDAGKKGQTIRADSEMATVGKINRT